MSCCGGVELASSAAGVSIVSSDTIAAASSGVSPALSADEATCSSAVSCVVFWSDSAFSAAARALASSRRFCAAIAISTRLLGSNGLGSRTGRISDRE